MKRLEMGLAMLLGVSAAQAQTPVRWLAHDLNRPKPPVVAPGKQPLPVPPPADAVVLFDGKDLSKWRSDDGGPARWKIRDGAMESAPDSGYLYTVDAFGDVQLHVEWAAPAKVEGHGQGRGNSGVFLMGLFEVQVLDSYDNDTYADGQAGSIYGQFPPLVNACLPPGQWQSYDVVFRKPLFNADGTLADRARITVFHNGVLIQDGVRPWGPTAWLQRMPYGKTADKLPLSLQDHGNPVRFRNIWLRELPTEEELIPPAKGNEPAVKLTAEEQKKYVGAYTNEKGYFGDVKLDGEQLRLHMRTGQVIDLVPRSATEFALRWTAGHIDFAVQPDGAVSGFTLHLAGDRRFIARR